AIWGMTSRHAPAPQASAPSAPTTASPGGARTVPTGEGIIVVPTPPRPPAKSGPGEERHATAAPKPAPAPAHHEPPRNQKPVARGKQAHHEPEHAASNASSAASRATAEAGEARTEPGPVEATSAYEASQAAGTSVRGLAGRSGPAVAHKLRAT